MSTRVQLMRTTYARALPSTTEKHFTLTEIFHCMPSCEGHIISRPSATPYPYVYPDRSGPICRNGAAAPKPLPQCPREAEQPPSFVPVSPGFVNCSWRRRLGLDPGAETEVSLSAQEGPRLLFLIRPLTGFVSPRPPHRPSLK